MAKFKVGDRVRFKNRNPSMVLEITAVYDKDMDVIMLRGVEGGNWVGASSSKGIVRIAKSKRKRAKRKKPEDYWP